MIINFAATNYLSFKERTTFSMVASDLPGFDQRLVEFGKFNMKLLPISAFYGGNAAGKSNLVDTLKFMRDFVTEGKKKKNAKTGVIPFLLDKKCRESDSKFEIEILVDNTIYQYGFSANQSQVTFEKLVTDDGSGEKLQFKRTGLKFQYGGEFEKKKKVERDQIKLVEQTTLKNQLFLTSLSFHNVRYLEPIIDWFENLIVIKPDANFNSIPCFFKEHSYTQILNEAIQKLDIGISSISSQKFPVELPDELTKDMAEDSRESPVLLMESSEGDRLKISRENGEISSEVLISNHLSEDEEDIGFSFAQESDGTKRIMDLIPALFDLANQNKTVIIDGLDRSLHPTLIGRLIESYFENCESKKLKSQLLFTTHNVSLMNGHLFRPDEIWVVDKGIFGASTLSSLVEFKGIQNEVDFQKTYMEGRFGGVPQIQIGGILTMPSKTGISE